MVLSPMRFKDYVWPHNPKIFEVTKEKRLVTKAVPFGRWLVKDMGTEIRIFKGEGEFAGKGAYSEYKKLEKVFDKADAGVLIHPVLGSVNAYFASLTLKQQPMENYVSYAFEFWEDCSTYTGGLKAVASKKTAAKGKTSQTTQKKYKVKAGDTLWGIASGHGMTLSKLISMNPQIKNPNLIYPGDTIYISEE